MKYFKLFEQFLTESVTPEQRDKIFADATKWAEGLKLDYKKNDGFNGKGWFMVHTELGTWTLDLTGVTKKAGQNSNYQETYSEDRTNLKWYITYPGRSNSYNYKSNTKAGNLKTFKSLIERFEEVKKTLELAEKFLEIVGINDRKLKDSVSFSGENLKNLTVSYRICGDGDLDYTVDKYGTKDYVYQCRYKDNGRFERTTFDATKGELFYYTVLAGKPAIDKLEGYDTDKMLEILELLKDKPVEEVWKLIEKGDWKDLEHQFRGKLSGKKFGL
jgi:hypothetical protein